MATLVGNQRNPTPRGQNAWLPIAVFFRPGALPTRRLLLSFPAPRSVASDFAAGLAGAGAGGAEPSSKGANRWRPLPDRRLRGQSSLCLCREPSHHEILPRLVGHASEWHPAKPRKPAEAQNRDATRSCLQTRCRAGFGAPVSWLLK